MIKILSTEQIRAADQYTIKNEPVASIDLMERASNAFVEQFITRFIEKRPVKVFCGVGNNGGDGLAIGRLLKEKGWEVLLYIVGDIRKGSSDFNTNLERSGLYGVIKSQRDFPSIEPNDMVVDAIFGSGLSRPLEGLPADLIAYLNEKPALKVAVDIASGLFADQPVPEGAVAFQPDFTFSFQLPKLGFFLPSNERFVGNFEILDIGLDESFIDKQPVDYGLTEKRDVEGLIPGRSRFAHKSRVGRLMLVAGSKGKMGAAFLCAKAAFRAGAGLVNVVSPKCGTQILQTAIPEAMVEESTAMNEVDCIPVSNDTVGLGPGIGTSRKTSKAFEEFLTKLKEPIVIDADGINLLAKQKKLLDLLPPESILTPHPGEFERLVGKWKDDYDKLYKLKSLCVNHKLNVVLKGHFSAVCDTKGKVFFNPTGNPGMATAGSGDVLTGTVSAFLAQNMEPFDALKLAVFLHGLAGDLASQSLEGHGLMASDIIEKIPEALSAIATLD